MSKRQSAARRLIQLVWDHNREATGFSWTRLNGSMYRAVMLAIDAGMRFAVSDFAGIYEELRGHYWFGTDNDHSQGEAFYSAAVKVDNLSACQSFEAWKKRPPFICEGRRLHDGARFEWKGHRVRVTSFAPDGQSLTACKYKSYVVQPGYLREKVEKRFKVTIEDLRASERAREKAVKASARKAA
jgi:hypothetical protein